MTASREERDYRRAAKKCTKGEMKQRLINTLVKKNTGLQAVEEFIRRERAILGGGNKTLSSQISNYKEERKIVGEIMRRKLREIIKTCITLRRRKTVADDSLVKILGKKSGEYQKIVKETREYSEKLREELGNKNEKKVNWLMKKYEMKFDVIEEMSENERNKYGMAEVLKAECGMEGEQLRYPEIVCKRGETLEISNDEKQVLALGPKFCVRKDLDEENFEIELEECIAKIKWDIRSEEEKKGEKIDLADVAIMSILSDDEREEVEEHEEYEEAKRKIVYHPEERNWNFGRRRTTDLKGNTMVILPGKLKFQQEANLEMLRAELKSCFKNYMRKHCDEKGRQESNLSKEERTGLNNLKKKFSDGGIIVMETDKSGRFAVMRRL